MKLSGVYPLSVPKERAYAMLLDPAILARCMPGCEALERIGENEYAMKMKVALAMVTGRFEGKVRISEPNPPNSFRMLVEGAGKIGFLRGDGVITLTGVSVCYNGDVQVGGTIANIGQRMIDTTARALIRKFFERIAAEAAKGGAPPAALEDAAD